MLIPIFKSCFSIKSQHMSIILKHGKSSRFYSTSVLRSFQLPTPFRKLQISQLHLKRLFGTTLIPKNNKLPTSKLPDKSKVYRLIGLAKPEKWRVLGAVGFLMITSSVTLAVPFCLGKVIDIIYNTSTDEMKAKLSAFCAVLFGIFIIGGLANFGRVYLMEIAGQRIIQNLRKMLYGSILRQEVAFFDKNKTGELINRLSSDTTVVGFSVTMNISDGLRSLFGVIASVSMMFYTSTHLAFFGLCTFPPIAGLMIIYGRYLRRISKKIQDSLAESTQVASEHISNVRTVRAFAQEDKEMKKYNGRIDAVLKLAHKDSIGKGIFFGLTGMTGNCVILAILYEGGLMMTESQITVGALTSFLMYAVYVTISVGGFTSFYSEFVKGLGASSRLWDLVDRPPQIPLKGGLYPSQNIQGNVSLQNISFAYPSRADALVFSDLNLNIESGSILAVVGSSGSGKSTITSLLLRFYDPIKGSVKIDGHDLKTLDPTWYRRQIGTVSQEPVLFSGSIRDNILYAVEDSGSISDEQLMNVAEQANALHFIRSFPKKFDTIVGERGVMLSGGQRQRISIARAIVLNPRILLLDEATSALDAESEHLVQEALERIMKNRTVITIAHRLSTIKNANFIAVLHEGSVMEYGTYSQLMQIENGMFQKLVKRQTVQT